MSEIEIDDNNIGHYVDKAYESILGRKPDTEGRNNYIKLIKTGEINVWNLPAIFKESKEYKDKTERESKEYKDKTERESKEYKDKRMQGDKFRLSFPIHYKELYKPFDDLLVKEIGISWFDAQKLYYEIGNSPGIYPDTALLFVELIKNRNFSIKKVLELGSGISTLFLSKVCEMEGVEFISYEEDSNYKEMNVNLLRKFGIKNYENIIKPITYAVYPSEETLRLLEKDIANLDLNVDLIFLDAFGELRNRVLLDSRAYDIPFVIYDDAETSSHLIKHVVNMKNDHNIYYYDRVGRLDRQQFISYPSKHNLMTFISKNIPCIGTW